MEHILPIMDTLNNVEKLMMLWTLICITPNVLLICVVVKNHLQGVNFYLFFLHWCVSNAMMVLSSFLYFAVVPTKYRTNIFVDLYHIHIVLPTLMVILVVLFMFREILNSQRRCRYVIYGFWSALGLAILFQITTSAWSYVFIVEILYVGAPIKAVGLFTVLIKIGMHAVKSSGEEDQSALLRITMSGAYIVLDIIVWSLQLMILMGILSEDVFVYVIGASYVDGFINVILLMCFNESARCYICAIFRRRDEAVSVNIINK